MGQYANKQRGVLFYSDLLKSEASNFEIQIFDDNGTNQLHRIRDLFRLQ